MAMEYPKSRDEWLALRHKYVSSTEVAALFGLSPYMTAYELAVVKQQADPDPEFEGNERMEWGIRMQHAIAKGIAERYGVKVRAVSGYAIDGHLHCRMGSSFDYEIVGIAEGEFANKSLQEMYSAHGTGVLEIKNVDWLQFKNNWKLDDGTIEAPAHIEVQVQHQLACIARDWAAIGVLVGGNSLELLIRESDIAVHQQLRKKCETFWNNLQKGILPPVELPADAQIISKIYGYAEPGKVIDASQDLAITSAVQKYAETSRALKAANDERDTAKAELLMAIGDAERVTLEGYSVSAGVVAETLIPAYTRKGYRNLRVTAKKDKTSGK